MSEWKESANNRRNVRQGALPDKQGRRSKRKKMVKPWVVIYSSNNFWKWTHERKFPTQQEAVKWACKVPFNIENIYYIDS